MKLTKINAQQEWRKKQRKRDATASEALSAEVRIEWRTSKYPVSGEVISRVIQFVLLVKLAFFFLQLKHPFNALTCRVAEIPSRIFQFTVVYFLSYFAASYLWLMQHSLWLSLSQVWQQGVTSGIALKMQIQLDFNFSYLGLCPLSRIQLICKCISIQLTVKFKCAFANVNSISARSHGESKRRIGGWNQFDNKLVKNR